MTPTQEQIEEAKKLMGNYTKDKATLNVSFVEAADQLIEASALIAASEQREKNQEVIRKAFDNIMQREGEVDGVELLIEAEAKILKGLCHGNPIRTGELHCGTFSQCKTIEAQQNISSNPPPQNDK